jgi:hypothetical protein
MKKTNNLNKIIVLALGLTIIPMSYAGLFDSVKEKPSTDKYKPKVTESLKDIPIQKWQDTESGRFAHALQYDDKLAKPVPYTFTKGKDFITEGIDYFEHLCKTEGKDYIYSTAKDVDTVAQLRSFEIPLTNESVQYYRFHPYALESPLFFNEGLSGDINSIMNGRIYKKGNLTKIDNLSIRGFYGNPYTNYQIKFNNDDVYNFKFDYPQVTEFYNQKKNITSEDRQKLNQIVKIDKVTAKYGFTWRGFSRPEDRSYGIAGGDLIVVDLEKNEIMAIQRTFIKASIQSNSPGNINWDGVGCFEQYKNHFMFKKLDFTNKSFIEKNVLIKNSSPMNTLNPVFLHKILTNKITKD